MTAVPHPAIERHRVGEGWSLFAQVIGAGREVLFLHGLPQDPNDLAALASRLSDAHRCHLLELPGYGESTPLDDPPAIAESRRRIALYAREHCADPPWIVGFSGGSYRALDLVLAGELAVAGVVLMAPVAAISEAMAGALRGGAEAIAAGIDIAPSLLPGWFSEGFLDAHPQHALGIARAAVAAGSPAAVAADARAFADLPDLRPRLGQLPCPAAVVVGELDATTTPEAAVEIAGALGDVPLEVIVGSGHFVHHEAPEAVGATLRSILLG